MPTKAVISREQNNESRIPLKLNRTRVTKTSPVGVVLFIKACQRVTRLSLDGQVLGRGADNKVRGWGWGNLSPSYPNPTSFGSGALLLVRGVSVHRSLAVGSKSCYDSHGYRSSTLLVTEGEQLNRVLSRACTHKGVVLAQNVFCDPDHKIKHYDYSPLANRVVAWSLQIRASLKARALCL